MAKFSLKVMLLGALALTASGAAAKEAAQKWSLVIHGGAGTIERSRITPEQDKAIRAALDRALAAGSAVLEKGGTSMDAVEAAIIILENDPHFNAGYGAVYTWDGTHTLDASIMDGATRKAGAVAGSTTTKNPIKLARAVMEHSPHVLLSGAGADQFAAERQLDQVPNSYFDTPERKRSLDEMKAEKLSWYDVDRKYGTVGAVAVDMKGHVAAATSTGGMTGKRWGRIGDSPIIGAGTYADDRACAVSATGSGEYFIRLGVAHEICARMRFKGEIPQTAANHVIKELGEIGGDGGVIVVAPNGNTAFAFNTPGMYRGRITSNGQREVAIYGDEKRGIENKGNAVPVR